jgi:hypothetical protein
MGRTKGRAAAADEATQALALLLERVATQLPLEVLLLLLRSLPAVELARLACVHKAFWVAWQSLLQQHPGPRYAPPTAQEVQRARGRSRFARAGWFGDVAVLQSMVAAGVEEHGTPLLQARENRYERQHRTIDLALDYAARGGHVQAVELLLGAGADVHAEYDAALRLASQNDHTVVV